MPATLAVAAPANVEYGFEPTPGAATNSSTVNESEAAAAGEGRNGPGSGDASPNTLQILADSWVLVLSLVGLALVLGIVTWRRYKSDGASTGMLTRLIALLAVMVALPLISLSNAQSAKPPAAPDGFFGMITQTEITGADTLTMTRGGVETLRLPLPWYSVQPDNAKTFDWGYMDTVMTQLSKAGIEVMPFLYSSPTWVTPKSTNLPVRNLGQLYAWSNFLSEAVKRYGSDGTFWDEHSEFSPTPVPKNPIKTWQIWNEANFFYFATPVLPSNYYKLLRASYPVVKAADPDGEVMLSGLYGSPPEKQIKAGKAMTSYKYLDKLYKLGAKKYFDVAALHPYTPNTAETAALLTKFRKVMITNNDRSTPMSITEVGWGSAPKGFLAVGSPAKQAKQLKSAYDYFLAERKKLNLRSVYWFAYKDVKANVATCNFCYSTGLFKAGEGLRPKPAWGQWTKIAGGKP